MSNFDSFLLWEAKSRDTIDFKKVYVDISGDLIAGLLLSQIIYWYLPDDRGRTKLRVRKEDHLWIAKAREDWWDEIRITAKQFDRACGILIKKGVLIKDYFRFDGLRTIHIRLDYDRFMELWQTQLNIPAITQKVNPQLPKGETRNYSKGKPAITQRVRPLTETTTETTTESNGSAKISQSDGSGFDNADITEKENLNQLADQIASLCQINIDLASAKTRDVLKGVTLALYGKSISPADLKSFSNWWYNEYWAGKKGQPPTPAQVGDTWGQFEAFEKEPRVKNHEYKPNLTEAQKVRLAELTIENK